MSEILRFPSSAVTPQGAFYFMNGTHPRIQLKSPDKSVVFELMGGGSIPDRFNAPECVQLTKPPKGLIAGWKMVDQQGANEDGTTWLDAVNEPMEIDLPVRITARDGKHLRRVVDALVGSLDRKKTSELSWFTQELGKWWGDVRWLKPPVEGYTLGGQRRTTEMTLRLRVDGGFWRTFDQVDEFRLPFESMVDNFDVDYVEDKNLGPNWPLYFQGPGGGYPYTSRGAARWRDDPARTFFTESRVFVAGPYRDFVTESDNQVVDMLFASLLEIGASQDIWVRMGSTNGLWNGYGTRCRISGTYIEFAAFNNFKKTVITAGQARIPIPPLPDTRYRVEAGGLDKDGNFNPRIFRLKRGGSTVFTAKDAAGVSALGASFRGVGWGGQAAGALVTQGTPASIKKISAGDMTDAAPAGKLVRINVGDQDMWDRFTLYGPGTFEIAAGPGSSQMVKFGPLLPNQIVRLNTDGQKRRIVDLTSVPPTANELLEYRQALAELESYAPIKNIGPTLAANASEFGVTPPQGNMHRLIQGWFTHPVPPKSPGRGVEQHVVACKITGGDSSSKIIAAGTPRRRYPQ